MQSLDAILIGKLRITITDSRKLVIHNEEKKQKTKPILIPTYPVDKEFCCKVYDGLLELGWELTPMFSNELYKFLFTFDIRDYNTGGSFVYTFCPRCKTKRNMMLYGFGAEHYTAKCLHCGREWVFDPEDVLIGQMKKKKSS